MTRKTQSILDIEARVRMIFRKRAKEGNHTTTCHNNQCKYPQCLCSNHP
jgi:hypothetical protein